MEGCCIVKTGRGPLFRRKKFWPQIVCVAVLAAGGGLSGIFGSAQLFVAAIIVAFLGLNEFGRWPYRTNLLVCSVGAVAGSICGVFTWFEMAAVFVLLVVIGGFVLYYRDRTNALVPRLAELSDRLAKNADLEGVLAAAAEMFREMAPEDAISMVLSDGEGGLYLPACGGKPSADLPRNGGAVWKVFASGRPYTADNVDAARDKPLYRDARSLMSAPMSACDTKLGVLQLESPRTSVYTEEELACFRMVAFVTAQSLYPFMTESVSEQPRQAAPAVARQDASKPEQQPQPPAEEAPSAEQQEVPKPEQQAAGEAAAAQPAAEKPAGGAESVSAEEAPSGAVDAEKAEEQKPAGDGGPAEKEAEKTE